MVSKWFLWLVCLHFGQLQESSGTELEESLHYFEIVHHHEINHRISKRSIDEDEDLVERDVSFQTLGRKFNLKLTKRVGLFSKNFRAYAVNKNHEKRAIDVDKNNMFTGYDEAEPWSTVASAYWDEKNSMTAKIKTKYETYVIEPAWRHLNNTSNNSMIAYKESDMKWDTDLGDKYCGFVDPQAELDATTANPEFQTGPANLSEAPPHRVKRQSGFSYKPIKTTCPLLMVADYRFFQTMGQGSLSMTTSYLIGLVDRVDKIYRDTDFGKGFMKMGFEIKEIRVHEEPTAVSGTARHYNEKKEEPWDTKELLEVFAQNDTHVQYCMSHLFTAMKFPMGTLGLSYLASPFRYNPGGICSPVYYKGGRQLYLNTGWSSSLNRYNRRLLTSEADLVTTHEFGHNWGSEHDPDSTECSPSSFGGGKYIMYTYSVSGYDTNNKIFSPCSRRAISTVLEAKHDVCFREPSDGFCGNMRVEGEEECDPGPGVKKDLDPCCNKYCKLRGNAQCSDVNSICCDSCQYAPSHKVCHTEQEESCEAAATCSGTAAACPTPDHKDDGTACIGEGKCKGGVCQAFCESNALMSCICDILEESCLRCCRDPRILNGTCKPFESAELGASRKLLPDGVACAQGSCNKGVCEKQVENLVERIWDIIEDITTSNFVEFMRANIVGTVIVFSLVLWIPLSCVISYLDRKKKKEEEERIVWHANDNRELISDVDRSKLTIHQSTRVRSREAKTPLPEPQVYRGGSDPYVARATVPPRYPVGGATAYSQYAKLLKAYPPPPVSPEPPVAPRARISESSYDELEHGTIESPRYVLDESPFVQCAETNLSEDEPLLSGSPHPEPVPSTSTDHTMVETVETINIRVIGEPAPMAKQALPSHSDTSLVLPEYVWKPDPKGRTYVHDLPPANLTKVQDFIKLQRKDLDKYYRLHSHRKPSVVGTPKRRANGKAHFQYGNAQSTGVFGVPLESLLERDREKDQERIIPLFIEQLLNHLGQHVTEEGLLRKPGQEKRVKELKEIINSDFYDCGFSWDNVSAHDASSLLKHFLRDLPVKLLSTPGDVPDAFIRVQGVPGPEDQLKALHLLVLLITDVQRDTLHKLLHFLKKITDNHRENKMTPGNVAMIMAPNLFPFDINPNRDMDKINKDTIFSNKAVQMLVRYQDILWSIPSFVINEIRRKFGSQQGLLKDTSLSPMSFGSLRPKVPQILTEKYFYELVKIKVTIPHLCKTTKVELEEGTLAQDIINRFTPRNRQTETSSLSLYEVGGNLDERKLPMTSHILSTYADNPSADWIIK